MTSVNLPYGESSLRVEIPDRLAVNIYEPEPMKSLGDPYPAILSGIRNPAAGPRLSERAQGAKNPLIVISDSTRPTPSGLIVAAALEELSTAGVSAEEVKVLVATGLHRPCTEDELVEMLGVHLMSTVEVRNHFAEDLSSLEFICNTSLGTPLHVNKLVTESDLLIGDGYIEPHFFAGYTGGGKNILPGVCGAETILCNHNAQMIDHPNSRAGVLEGNPIYMDIVDGAELVDYGFSINVTLNNQKEVSGVFAGDFKEAHLKGTHFLDEKVKVRCERADITIVTNGGYPLDRDLYQAVKAMTVGEAATKDGGVIIVTCECRDSVGHPYFQKLVQESSGSSAILDKVRSTDEVIIDQWQAQILGRILERFTVICVTGGVDKTTLESMHLTWADDLPDALRLAQSHVGRDPTVNVFPGGPSTIPVVR